MSQMLQKEYKCSVRGEVDEMTSAILRFPGNRLASFTRSFGAADISEYRIMGAERELRVDPAYEFASELVHHLTIKGKTHERKFPKRDQFAPELTYSSDCRLKGGTPEPSGEEGLADVRIISTLYRSAGSGKPVTLGVFDRDRRPTLDQEKRAPSQRAPRLYALQSRH